MVLELGPSLLNINLGKTVINESKNTIFDSYTSCSVAFFVSEFSCAMLRASYN